MFDLGKFAIDRIATFSDIHFGRSKDSREKIGSCTGFIDWFLKDIASRNIDAIVFCGDWFDNRNAISVETLNVAYDQIKRMSGELPLFLIVGNHDSNLNTTIDVNSLKPFNEIDDVYVIAETSTMETADDRKVLLFPWNGIVDHDMKITGDFAFGHFAFEGAALVGDVDHSPTTQEMILTTAPLVFSGHYHVRKEYPGTRGKIISVGSPFELDWGDSQNDKGYYILDTRSRQYEFIPNTVSPRHFRVNLSDLSETPEMLDMLEVEGNYLKLVIDEKYDFVKVSDIMQSINRKCPKKPCDIDYNHAVSPESSASPEASGSNAPRSDISMTNLEYILKYIESDMKDSDFDENVDRKFVKELAERHYRNAEGTVDE